MTSTRKSLNKPHLLARELEKRIRSDAGYDPPPINILAEENNVSYQTMWKAVRILTARGILVTLPPKKIAVAPRLRGKNPEVPPPCHIGSTEQLVDKIKTRIENGIYKIGQPLPKMYFFTLTEKVCASTVGRAIHRLAGANLVHQQRRRWIAGPEPLHKEYPARTREWLVALLLLADTQSWPGLFQNPFNEMFMSPFKSELTAHGIEISPVVWNKTDEDPGIVPCGLDQIRSRIAQLGKRYSGVFAFTTFPRKHGVEEWIDSLCPFKKPVIYFDSADTGGFVRRSAQRPRGTYFRLHLDERSACLLALRELARNGHEVIAIHGHSRADWTRRRTNLLRSLSKEASPKMKIVLSEDEEPFWDQLNEAPRPFLQGAADLLLRAGPGRPSDLSPRRALLDRTPSMTGLIRRHRPTAFIGMGDGLTREYYFWFQAAGISIPRDMSMISFDNMTVSLFIPVSTVDFGLARLGYLAAHLLIGDIAVRADRHGFVPGPCALVNRGSIGAPSR